uniref:Peptidase_M16_C domain-containing protein n=1 Tax=Steinernema glaseri TaxID=37863 RepID=A0A1I7YH81_9BILA
MSSYKPGETTFNLMMEKLRRKFEDAEKNQPRQYCSELMELILSDRRWSQQQLLASSELVTLDTLNKFIPKIWKALHLELIVNGNFTKEDAIALGNTVLDEIQKNNKSIRPLFSNEMKLSRQMKIPEGGSYIYEHHQDTHANSCVELLLQTGVKNTWENMLLELLAQVMKEAAFDTLRTKEQLGYTVFAYANRSLGTQGLSVLVQGSYDPEYVEERIESFLDNFKNTLCEMTDETYDKHVDALAVSRLEKPKFLIHAACKVLLEIMSQEYSFNRDVVEVEELRKITKEELLEFYDEKISAKSKKRQKLVVRVYSTVKPGKVGDSSVPDQGCSQSVRIEDISSFKAGLSIYPGPAPAMEVPSLGIDVLSAKV